MVRLGLIGSGRWGQKILDTASKIPECRLNHVKTYDYKDMYVYDLDGLIIATPVDTHAEIVKAFPDTYLLVEKPLATDMKDVVFINNEKIMVGHTYLYNDNLQKELEKVGKLKFMYFNIDNMETYGSQSSVLWELCPHGVALAISLLGMPKNILGTIKRDQAFIKLAYSDSVSVEILCNWHALFKQTRIEVHGEKGSFIFDDTEPNKISPLENELREFIGFIEGGQTRSGLKLGKQVVSVLSTASAKLF